MFSIKPLHPIGPDGRMPLGDHLREFRGRLMRSLFVFFAIFVVALYFHEELLEAILGPYNDARIALDQDVQTEAYVAGATGPLMLRIKLCAVAALVLASPFWLSQIWGFIVPGLHKNEKMWSRLFAVIAGPLFMAGVAVGYYVLPKGLEVLIGFTPDAMQNLIEFGAYFSFFTRMLLVFGISFQIPLFVVMLSLAGVVSGKTIGKYRPWIVVGTFVFAAVATPSTDPFSMLMLALPMLGLFLIAEVIARFIDRVRGRKKAAVAIGDDELSPL
ncbi:twin-arginine translocase subunit TatC [Nocardioides gilvus]|uniref:twin-arginine translocase subunit TatC n=1 Tax=Nocardioides gilvus TaxID=1735589 RepID=UPI001EF6A208|nr:twin-arginine translocase subunit TatC [Nocardioides gilvus]